MRLVAVTGSYGSGKSTVLKFARSLRFPAIDADKIVAALYRDPKVKKKLLREFGSCSKKELAKLVFSSPSKRRKLESILHPLVWAAIKTRLSSIKKRGKPLGFVEVPLLFEAGWQKRFDETIFVRCPRQKCLKRLEAKGVSGQDALLRLKAQLPQKKKIKKLLEKVLSKGHCRPKACNKKACHIIDNGGSLASTRKQVRLLVEKLMEGNA